MEQQVRFCMTSDGVRIAYATLGAGTPIVRVISFLTHLEFERSNPVWQDWIATLSARHLFVRYDGRGMGLSDRDVSDFSLDARVHDLEAVVDALDLPHVALLGISAGGAIAIAYTARHPERVSHLITSSTNAYPSIDPAARAALRDLVLSGWGQDTDAFHQLLTSVGYPDADRAFLSQHAAMQRASATPKTIAVFIKASATIDTRPLFSQIRVPTLVIHRSGEYLPVERGRELAAAIPGARFLLLEGRNHLPLPGEPAAGQFFQAITDFVSDVHALGTVPLGGVPVPPDNGHQPESVETGGPVAAQTPAASGTGNPARLTTREVEVLRLIAAGRSNAEIADTLVLSIRTVERHITTIYEKVGASGKVARASAATYAHMHHLIPSTQP